MGLESCFDFVAIVKQAFRLHFAHFRCTTFFGQFSDNVVQHTIDIRRTAWCAVHLSNVEVFVEGDIERNRVESRGFQPGRFA